VTRTIEARPVDDTKNAMRWEQRSIDVDHVSPQSVEALGLVVNQQKLQLHLCRRLEEIADSLPKALDRGLALQASAALPHCRAAHVGLQDGVLFKMARRRMGKEAEGRAMISQLEDEHARDTDHAYEVADTLETLGRGGALTNPEMLGYMLRGYFESQRRHLAWETAIALPVIWRCFDRPSMAELHRRVRSQVGEHSLEAAIAPLMAYRATAP
jgi:hemerythrin-like domain-containing protein